MAKCNAGTQPAERCGFPIGKFVTEPCYLMNRIVGVNGVDNRFRIRLAKLPRVSEWLSRKDPCGKVVANQKFCDKSDSMYVWEAYAMKIFRSYEEIQDMKAPISQGWAIAAEGIGFWESREDETDGRCIKYEDWTPSHQLAYTDYDIYRINQYSHMEQSLGAFGMLAPVVNDSSTYISLVDREGIGIICAWDEFYISQWHYSTNSGEDRAHVWFQIFFRPRELKATDLLVRMLKDSCKRKCMDENVIEWPCVDDCYFTDVSKFDDAKEYKIKGQTKTGAEWKKKHDKRAGYIAPCLDVCTKTPTPGTCQEDLEKCQQNYRSLEERYNKVLSDLNDVKADRDDKVNKLNECNKLYDQCAKDLKAEKEKTLELTQQLKDLQTKYDNLKEEWDDSRTAWGMTQKSIGAIKHLNDSLVERNCEGISEVNAQLIPIIQYLDEHLTDKEGTWCTQYNNIKEIFNRIKTMNQYPQRMLHYLLSRIPILIVTEVIQSDLYYFRCEDFKNERILDKFIISNEQIMTALANFFQNSCDEDVEMQDPPPKSEADKETEGTTVPDLETEEIPSSQTPTAPSDN